MIFMKFSYILPDGYTSKFKQIFRDADKDFSKTLTYEEFQKDVIPILKE